VESGVLVYPSTRIWAPWNLVMMEGSCLGDYVDCYNVTGVTLEEHSVVSQYSFLCTASHDFDQVAHPLVTAAIHLEAYSWVTAAVVLARSTVLRDVGAWKVSGGNPLRVLRDRKLSRGQLEEHFTGN
jgi:putative colanic acid biosynthesis acetyltransferase WcaF